MTSTQVSIGRQLLVAMISNDEAEFSHLLDAHCLQIRGHRLERDTAIEAAIEQFRAAEISLGLEYDLASCKMIRSEMMDRLATNQQELLAA
ncbi:MAG: hypothetical protein D4S02_04000 [Rhodocyclaceae bacterium]|nr:MAG: hypothetical protein D4S02_04000 [Rhodocyclaceae bacterium]